MMNDLQAKVALITGASRGIGRATALAMARAGARIVAVARTAQQLQDLTQQIEAETGQPALPCTADVSQEADVQAMVRAAMDRFGQIDILVNNAGVRIGRSPLWETTVQEWDTTIAVNLRAAFLCCREVLPGMIERRSGHIVNVISTVTQIGLETMSAYSAAKWGLLGLTRVLVKEARPYGIRVTAISPGGTDTTFRPSPRPDYLEPEIIADAMVYAVSLPEKASVHDLVIRPMVETNF